MLPVISVVDNGENFGAMTYEELLLAPKLPSVACHLMSDNGCGFAPGPGSVIRHDKSRTFT
jgi:hypothetical protein